MPLAKTERDIEIERWDTPMHKVVPGSETSENPAGVRGMHVGRFMEYPKSLYRAQDGHAMEIMTVPDADAEQRYAAEGWATSSTQAIATRTALQEAIGNAAAEAAYQAQRMTAKARADYERAEQTTEGHVTDVTPKRKGDR